MIEKLVELGANVHVKNKTHINCLHVAVQGNKTFPILFFLSQGL